MNHQCTCGNCPVHGTQNLLTQAMQNYDAAQSQLRIAQMLNQQSAIGQQIFPGDLGQRQCVNGHTGNYFPTSG